jgi:hypothetical protein
MRTRAAGLVVALGLVAVRSTAAAADAKWQGFDTYPGARALCSDRIKGGGADGGSLGWWSYVTTDTPETVTAYYDEHHHSLRAADMPKWFVLRGPAGETLGVYDVAGGGYSTCARKPDAKDRTVILVMGALVPPKTEKKRLVFDGPARGCGDAVVVAEADGGKTLLRVKLNRRGLKLDTRPAGYDLNDSDINFYIFTYDKRPSGPAPCSEAFPGASTVKTLAHPLSGRMIASISTENPKPGECYQIDLRFERVILHGRRQAVDLEPFELKGVWVGGKAPLTCPR